MTCRRDQGPPCAWLLRQISKYNNILAFLKASLIVILEYFGLYDGYSISGGIMDRPVLGSWPKQRIEIIYAIGLAALLLSVGLQTW